MVVTDVPLNCEREYKPDFSARIVMYCDLKNRIAMLSDCSQFI